MSRAAVLVVALLLGVGAAPRSAHAQDAGGGLLGLPLVIQEGGWARYVTQSPEAGRTEVVMRLGEVGRHKGRAGRWVRLEVNIPEVGRVSISFLIAGGRFSADNIIKVRVVVPGQPVQESDEKVEGLPASALKARMLKKHKETVAGRALEVTEYAFDDGLVAGWSPAVPPLGITRVSGSQPMQLVAFGVGGDPWKGAQVEPAWPKDALPPNKAP